MITKKKKKIEKLKKKNRGKRWELINKTTNKEK